jgi:hypothetical protein
MGLEVKDFVFNNNALIKLKYRNFSVFDTCKHLIGSLKDNLKAFGCVTQKGDFNHNLASEWETMAPELQTACLKYLKGDVIGLAELYDKLNGNIHEQYGVNITSFISTSQLTFALFKASIRSQYYISLPTLESEAFYRQAIRGGRTYPSRRRFISESYIDYVNGRLDFDDIKDYCIDADVVSLYPASMANNEYPIGDEKRLEAKYREQEFKAYESKEFEANTPGAMGIYKVSYVSNKKLAHSIAGTRLDTGSLEWNLKDGVGHFSSVAIVDMLRNGYDIKLLDGYYWEESAPIFRDYIGGLFKKKEELAADGKKGSVDYKLAKLLMNGLYGKCIQRPIHLKTASISTNAEFWAFWAVHIVESITQVGDCYHISGTPRDFLKKEESITKPSHLGVFILDYSRRIMVDYMKQANPHFNREVSGGTVAEQTANDFYYTDTDSIQMHVTNAERIPNLGGSALGEIQDDLGKGCKIIRGLWIAPKLYMLEYIKQGDPRGKVRHHFRGKGLNLNQLSVEIFERLDDGYIIRNTREFQMKRIGAKRNSKQKHLQQFSILHETHLTKFVNANKWKGRRFVNECDSVPHGADTQ